MKKLALLLIAVSLFLLGCGSAIVDTTSPVISHELITSAEAGKALSITASASDNVGLRTETYGGVSVSAFYLYYKDNVTTDWVKIPFIVQGLEIDVGLLPLEGLQYYLEATDTSGNTSRLPATAPAVPYSVTVF